jgi:hypothetical protein
MAIPDPKLSRLKLKMPRQLLSVAKPVKLDPLMVGDSVDIPVLSMGENIVDVKPVGQDGGEYVYDAYRVENPNPEFLESRGLFESSNGMCFFDERIRNRFRFNKMLELRIPPTFGGRFRLGSSDSCSERTARDLLLRYVGSKEFRRYMRFGYVVVHMYGFMWVVPGEKSYRGSRVEQWQNNVLLKKYCVHFANNNVPSTDACIMRLALISAGIDELGARLNVAVINETAQPKRLEDSRKILPYREAYNLFKERYESELMVA